MERKIKYKSLIKLLRINDLKDTISYLRSPDSVILVPPTTCFPSLSSFPAVSNFMIVVPRLPIAGGGGFCGDCRGKGTEGSVGGGNDV